MGHFAGSNIGIFEIKGSEDSRQCEIPKFHMGKHKVMARGHMERWIGVVRKGRKRSFGLIRRSAWFRSTGLDLEES
jgi:hypothetical protein